MELKKYDGRTVVVQTDNNKIFRGKVTDYLSAENGEADVDSIVIRDINSDRLIELQAADIKEIDIIN